MKGYLFIRGVDGFGEDIAPAPEEKIYTDFKKAFNHLVELNHNIMENNPDSYEFYEDGYGEDYYPDSDKELALAEKEKNGFFLIV